MAQKSAEKSARRSSRKPSRRGGRRWSARVTRESDALDLESRVFPKKIAASLKRSAGTQPPAQIQSVPLGAVDVELLHQSHGQESAAGKRKALQRDKGELRKQFGRD